MKSTCIRTAKKLNFKGRMQLLGLQVSVFGKLLLIDWEFHHITTIGRVYQRTHPKTATINQDCLSKLIPAQGSNLSSEQSRLLMSISHQLTTIKNRVVVTTWLLHFGFSDGSARFRLELDVTVNWQLPGSALQTLAD